MKYLGFKHGVNPHNKKEELNGSPSLASVEAS